MKKQKLVNDFISVSGGIIKSIEGAKDYSKNKIKERISLIFEEMNFTKKTEMNELREMLIKSRIEIDSLKNKVKTLEKKLIKKK